MARVTIEEILEGSLTTVANVNSTLTSWNSATADIGAENIRNEALERRNLQKTFQVFGDTNVRDFFDGIHVTLGVVALSQLGTPIHVGGFDKEDDDEIIVRAGFAFQGTLVAATVEGAIGFKSPMGGAPAVIQSTRRSFSAANSIVDTRGIANYHVCHRYTATSVATDLWFTLMIGVASGGAPAIQIIDPYITAIRLRA